MFMDCGPDGKECARLVREYSSSIGKGVRMDNSFRNIEIFFLRVSLIGKYFSSGITYPKMFFKLYAFLLLTSTLVPGINYFVVTTHPLHQLQVRKRSSIVLQVSHIEIFYLRVSHCENVPMNKSRDLNDVYIYRRRQNK